MLNVPFEKLPKPQVEALNSARSSEFLSRILFDVPAEDSRDTIKHLIYAFKQSHVERPLARSIARCPLPSNEVAVNAYFEVASEIERMTRIRLEERVNSLLIARWLSKHSSYNLNNYLRGGLLSEIASNDILVLADTENNANNLQPGVSGSELLDTGNTMIDERLRLASLKAFGAEPKLRTSFSQGELEKHQAQVKKYREELPKRKAGSETMVEAVEAYLAEL